MASKTLVTGASGFVGSAVVRALADRGDELRVLARRTAKLDHLDDIQFSRVTGDITDRRAVRRALKDVSRVFHVAGMTSMRPADAERLFKVNVEGSKLVFEEALRAGVERVVHTSSVAAIGPAPRRGTADETQSYTGGKLGVPYVDSKHAAEVEAMRFAARGLPLVCVNPSFVLGPDHGATSSSALIRRFLLGRIPAYVDGGLNIVDVRDVAAGHLLADERGESGERYILGGRNFTLDRLFADLGRISGVAPPAVRLPGPIALAAVQAATRLGLPFRGTPDEVRSGMEWWTYRNTKAKRELGFSARPHEETLEEAVASQKLLLGDRVAGGSAPLPLRLVGRAVRLGERLIP